MTANTEAGASLFGNAILVSGNRFLGNKSFNGGADGLDVSGTGVTVAGNEAGGNGGNGLSVTDYSGTYNPAVNDPKNPNPAPTVTAGNFGNGNGIVIQGTQTVSGNVVAGSASTGIDLECADYSAVAGNAITGSGYAGIFAGYASAFLGTQDSGLKISGNQISGGANDGIYFYETAGGVISYNNVTGNQGIGIHLPDYTADYGNDDYAPTVVTQNRALKNVLFDAADDAVAKNGDNGAYGPTINVWTKNLFGTTDPVGLSK